MAKREMPKRQPAVETEVVETPVVNEPIVELEKPKTVTGVVSNCSKLNIRTKPTKVAKKPNVVCEVPSGAQLIVDMDKSVGDWYKVRTADGAEGFCMKMYVTLKK